VDNELDIVIGGGYTYLITANGRLDNLYNIAVRTTDDSKGDRLALGGTYVDGALTRTYIIATGNIIVHGGYIYVLIAKTASTSTIYKLQWDGTSLNEISSAAGPPKGIGIYFDLWGNLVVVNQDYGSHQEDLLWYYDTDLAYVSKLDGLHDSMLLAWDAVVGGAYFTGGVASYGELGTPVTPGTPATIATGLGPNSVCTIPGSAEDEVWLIIYRVIDGSGVRFLEQMQPRDVVDQEDQWFVDSALDYDDDDTAVSTVSGLDHLEGETVQVFADGANFGTQTVTSGTITLSESANRIIVGLPFRYTLKPMRFDLDIDGGTKGSLKGFKEVVLSLYNTLGVHYGVDVDHLFRIDFRTTEPYGSPPSLYSGDKVVVHDGSFNVEDSIIITDNGPFPCVVRAIIPRIHSIGR